MSRFIEAFHSAPSMLRGSLKPIRVNSLERFDAHIPFRQPLKIKISVNSQAANPDETPTPDTKSVDQVYFTVYKARDADNRRVIFKDINSAIRDKDEVVQKAKREAWRLGQKFRYASITVRSNLRKITY